MNKCPDNKNKKIYSFNTSCKSRCNNELVDKCHKKKCTIYVKNKCELEKALQCLESDTKIKLCEGIYDNIDLCLYNKCLINNLELIGDDHSLSGVSFIHGACYSSDGLYYMPHLSCDIGTGEYILNFDSHHNKVTVNVINGSFPNFSQVFLGVKVRFMDKYGNFHDFTVNKGCNNEIYFEEQIDLELFTIHDLTSGMSTGTGVKGVGFTILPNVIIKSNLKGIISGVKCLRMVGIHFDFNHTKLIYGENYSNIEGCVFSKTTHVISNAMLSVNRAPNTIYGKFMLNNQTDSKFIFNSVLGIDGQVIANNSNGLFAFSIFVGNDIAFKIICNANMNGSYNKYLQVKSINMYVSEGSKLKTANSYVCYDGPEDYSSIYPIGLDAKNDSIIVTGIKDDIHTPAIFIRTDGNQELYFKNAVILRNSTFFYNWGGEPTFEIGSTDPSSHYHHT